MNSNELFNELKKFNESNYNVILIDGPWGSGKTYLINRFIKYASTINNLKVFYVSMLGKKNVDDINTSLFSEVHKNNTVTNLIPSAINAIDLNDNNLDFVLKLNNKSNRANQEIVILDDLERYASTNYDEFLAYISNLVLKGAKIICVSNLAELGSGELYNFNLYKEKIFDRVYEAELFNNDVIKEKLGEFSDYLDKTLINLFNKNFRIVEKTYNFLKDLKTIITKNKIKLSYFDKKALIFYSIIVLNVYFNNKKLHLEDFKIRPSQEILSFNKLSFENENNAWSSIFIYEYAINTPYIYRYKNDYIFIKSLLKAYIFAKYDEFIDYYKHKEFTLEDLKKAKEINIDIVLSSIKLITNETYNEIFNALFIKMNSDKVINNFLAIYRSSLTPIQEKFFGDLLKKFHSEKEHTLIENLKIDFDNKDFDDMFSLINNNLDLFMGDIDSDMEKFLINNNYLLDLNNANEVYLLNYIHLVNNSTMHDNFLEYLNSLPESKIRNELISILTYIAEGISE